MTQPAPESTDPIVAAREVWLNAWKAADITKLESVFCDEVVFMPPNETSLYGKEEALEWYRDYFDHFRVTVVNGTEREVTYVGDLAIEQWTYMVAIDPIRGSERIRDDGRSLTIWKREADGKWKVSQTIWNSIRPIGSGTSRYLARLKERQ